MHTGMDDAELERRLPSFHDQEALHLRFNRITARGARALAAAPLARLRELNLYENQLGPEGMRALACAPWASDLRALNVCGNLLGVAGAAALAGASWPALERLHIGFNDLGDDGAEALAAADMPRLTTLNVRLNGIGPRGAIALVERFARELRLLGIEDNPLGAGGLAALVNAPFERLEWLNVRDTEPGSWRRFSDAAWWPAFVDRKGKLSVDAEIEDGERCRDDIARTVKQLSRTNRGVGTWAVQLEVTGERMRRRFVLTGNDWTVGRADFCDLSMPRTILSKIHDFLWVRDGVLYIQDSGSTNGTFVNGRVAHGPTALSPEDRILYAAGRVCRMLAPPIPMDAAARAV